MLTAAPDSVVAEAGLASITSDGPRPAQEHRIELLPPSREGGPRHTGLIGRVQSEFREMPGMQLTLRQAARLWGVDLATSEWVLSVLVGVGFLRKCGDRYSQTGST